MKTKAAAFLIALSLLLVATPATPALAAPPAVNLGGHWSYFKWGPGWTAGVRMFYVYDRSGNATVAAALQHVINDLKYDLNARNAWGIVPAPVYVEGSANTGQCDSSSTSPGGGFSGLGGYSFITICSGTLYNGTSIAWTSGGHYAENYHPSIHLDRQYADYNTTYSALAHELLHTMGVGHTDNCNDLMGGAEFGCRLTVGALKKPSGADYDALTNFYGGYGAWRHPWNA